MTAFMVGTVGCWVRVLSRNLHAPCAVAAVATALQCDTAGSRDVLTRKWTAMTSTALSRDSCRGTPSGECPGQHWQRLCLLHAGCHLTRRQLTSKATV